MARPSLHGLLQLSQRLGKSQLWDLQRSVHQPMHAGMADSVASRRGLVGCRMLILIACSFTTTFSAAFAAPVRPAVLGPDLDKAYFAAALSDKETGYYCAGSLIASNVSEL